MNVRENASPFGVFVPQVLYSEYICNRREIRHNSDVFERTRVYDRAQHTTRHLETTRW